MVHYMVSVMCGASPNPTLETGQSTSNGAAVRRVMVSGPTVIGRATGKTQRLALDSLHDEGFAGTLIAGEVARGG